MRFTKRWTRWRRRCLLGAIGGCLFLPGLGNCDLGQINTTTTTTLDGRDVITQLLRAAILTPINSFLNAQIDSFVNQGSDPP